eukprot:364426-Chlamydomonas_euryale.AAC.38
MSKSKSTISNLGSTFCGGGGPHRTKELVEQLLSMRVNNPHSVSVPEGRHRSSDAYLIQLDLILGQWHPAKPVSGGIATRNRPVGVGRRWRSAHGGQRGLTGATAASFAALGRAKLATMSSTPAIQPDRKPALQQPTMQSCPSPFRRAIRVRAREKTQLVYACVNQSKQAKEIPRPVPMRNVEHACGRNQLGSLHVREPPLPTGTLPRTQNQLFKAGRHQ